jgi:hypothetical protein
MHSPPISYHLKSAVDMPSNVKRAKTFMVDWTVSSKCVCWSPTQWYDYHLGDKAFKEVKSNEVLRDET